MVDFSAYFFVKLLCLCVAAGLRLGWRCCIAEIMELMRKRAGKKDGLQVIFFLLGLPPFGAIFH